MYSTAVFLTCIGLDVKHCPFNAEQGDKLIASMSSWLDCLEKIKLKYTSNKGTTETFFILKQIDGRCQARESSCPSHLVDRARLLLIDVCWFCGGQLFLACCYSIPSYSAGH